MSKLNDAIKHRLYEVNAPEPTEDNMKTFTIRLPLEVIEQLDTLGSILEMKRTTAARLILVNALSDVMKEFQITNERFGMSFEDVYAIETGEKEIEIREVKKND